MPSDQYVLHGAHMDDKDVAYGIIHEGGLRDGGKGVIAEVSVLLKEGIIGEELAAEIIAQEGPDVTYIAGDGKPYPIQGLEGEGRGVEFG